MQKIIYLPGTNLDYRCQRDGQDYSPEPEKLSHCHDGKDYRQRVKSEGPFHDKRFYQISFNDHINKEIGCTDFEEDGKISGLCIADECCRDYGDKNTDERHN